MSKRLSYWSYLNLSEDVEDSCCLFSPTNDSTFPPSEDLNFSSRDWKYLLPQDVVSVMSPLFGLFICCFFL